MAYDDDDDEVSTVLRHFRPRPDFALRGASGLLDHHHRDWINNRRRRRHRRLQQQQQRSGGGGGGGGGRRKKKDGNDYDHCDDRGYSSVRYLAPITRRYRAPGDDPLDNDDDDDGGVGGGGSGSKTMHRKRGGARRRRRRRTRRRTTTTRGLSRPTCVPSRGWGAPA